MKKILISLTLLLLTVQFAIAAPGDNFKLVTDNSEIELSELKGQVVYVDFWASWCSPCRKSFPWMNKMQAKYENKGFKVIGINLDSTRKPTIKFLKKYPALFTVAYDPDGNVADSYNVQVMPTSYLIGRDGKLIMTHKGFRHSQTEDLENEFKKALMQ